MQRQQPKFVVRGFDRFDVEQGTLGKYFLLMSSPAFFMVE